MAVLFAGRVLCGSHSISLVNTLTFLRAEHRALNPACRGGGGVGGALGGGITSDPQWPPRIRVTAAFEMKYSEGHGEMVVCFHECLMLHEPTALVGGWGRGVH